MGTVTIYGISEMRKILNELPTKISKQLLMTSLKKAAEPVQNDARSNVPVKKGMLKKSIGIKLSSKNESVYIAPLKKRKSGAWYAHFVEFGTKGFGKRTRTGSGKKRTTIAYSKGGDGLKARPFMQPAFEKNKDTIIENVKRILGGKISAYLRANAPKYF